MMVAYVPVASLQASNADAWVDGLAKGIEIARVGQRNRGVQGAGQRIEVDRVGQGSRGRWGHMFKDGKRAAASMLIWLVCRPEQH